MTTLTLPDLERGYFTEEEFGKLPEPDLYYFELDDGDLRLVNSVTTDWHSFMITTLINYYRDRDWVRKMQEYAQANVPRYWIVDEHPSDPADAIVHQFVNRGGRFEPELEIELSKLVEA